MIKKGVGSLLAVSILAFGAVPAFADGQQNTTSVSQGQLLIGSIKNSTSFSKAFTDKTQLQNGVAQAQSGSATGVQVQGATTTGPVLGGQGQTASTNLSDSQGSTEQTTNATVDNGQSAIVTEPSSVVQGQVAHTNAQQFQASVAGGATIQHQFTHRLSYQYQSAVKTVSPR